MPAPSLKREDDKDKIYGFPMQTAPWCNGRLKLEPLKQFNKPDVTQYLGICKDEPKRVSRLQNTNKIALPAEKYPDYWNLMLFWDKNSPVSFRADKKTLSDFEKRFKLEDKGEIPTNKKFRWEMIK